VKHSQSERETRDRQLSPASDDAELTSTSDRAWMQSLYCTVNQWS